jgi:hypothetical protein
MIKALSLGKRKSDDTPVATLILGLTDENLRRLREGMPIYIDGRDVSLPKIDVVIMAGRTEEEMMRDLKEASER